VTFSIITADERLREHRGAKILLLGPTGVGKTWELRTLDPARTLFADVEAGDLAIAGLPVPTVRIEDWPTARDLAARVAGPDKSFAASTCYSQAHYEACGGALEGLDGFNTVFFDSITALSRLCLRWCEQQPECVSDRTGRKDIRGAYGLLAREMLLWLTHLQHARRLNVIFVGVLERVVDDLNVATWQLQCEGAKTARELPAIVDQLVSYQFLDFGDGKPPMRGFVCTSPNSWGYPAKDRSGRLEQIEPPDLGKLLAKLTTVKPEM
jgi:hypothetical protein